MNLSKITVAPIFPVWLILLLFFLGLGGTILQYWLVQRRLGGPKAFSISLLRLGSIIMILSFALNPFWVTRNERRVNPALNIFIDSSPSMGLPGDGRKGSRLDEAKAFLLEGPKPLLKSLSEMFDVRLYVLGESLKTIDGGELADLKPGQRKANLTDAMQRPDTQNILAMLFSDGNLRWEKTKISTPILTVPMGGQKTYKDILIKAVKAPPLAFRDRGLSIDVTIKSYGYSGLAVPLILKEGNKLLVAKNLRIDESPAEVTVSLPFIPEKVGQHNLHLSVPSQFGESLTSNNNVNLSLKVVRDKIRILMISGSPSLNYRFMRMALKSDPSIDLLSFVILRTPSDILNVPVQEQSLIPLPIDSIFSKELKNFDLLIFDNLPYPMYISPHYYGNVRDFVKEGGGFAMIGGPNFFYDIGKTPNPLEEMLPIHVTEKENYRRRSLTEVKLSRGGMTHPVTQFSSDENENLNLWRDMPALDGINLFEPKTSGTVLLESADGNPRPILSIGSYGKGRVLVLGTDYSWKWYMGMVAKGKGNWAYLRFTEKMVRWLTKDPGLDPIQVILPEKKGTIGEESEFRIKVREEGIQKGKSAMVSLSVFNPDGMKIGSQLKATKQPGEYFGSFFPEKEGTYKLKIETPAVSMEESWVFPGQLENFDAAPDHENLGMISASTGGKSLARGSDLLKEMEAYREKSGSRFVEEKRFPLWSMPYVLISVLALLGAEWYLRRKWGLI